jgi:hypothetical protein
MTLQVRSRHAECVSRSRPVRVDDRSTITTEGLIRTFSVSLVAVAAIAASLLLVRKGEDDRPSLVPAGGEQAPRLQLDAIRAAGL